MTKSQLWRAIFAIGLFGACLGLPISGLAGVATSFEEPDTALASNVAIDIISHNGGVWLATSRGVNYTYDNGNTWLLYNMGNGLLSEDISAIFSQGGRFFVGANYDTLVNNEWVSASRGILYTDDNGDTWNQVPFGPSGLNIPRVFGGNRTIFDITGFSDTDNGKDWLFFASFAGGLLASQDNGETWRRIYASTSDSVNFWNDAVELSYTNRYFSAAVDSSHNDSLFLWAGTAGGVIQYIYTPGRNKLYSRHITDIAFCTTCGDTSWLFIAGNNGISRGRTGGGPFMTRGIDDGLAGPSATAVVEFGGRVFAGTAASPDGASTGLSVSDNYAESFSGATLPEAVGVNRRILDFAVIRDRVYLAAEEAGLFVSTDTGDTWTQILPDSTNQTAANRRNVVNALDAFHDTLRVGTDSGLVNLVLASDGAIVSRANFVFPENFFIGTRIIALETQQYGLGTAGTEDDSSAVYTVTRPLTANAKPYVTRSRNLTTWTYLRDELLTYDIGFVRDTAFMIGAYGATFTRVGADPDFTIEVVDRFSGDKLDDDTLTVIATRGDTVVIGALSGLAISDDRTDNFRVFRANFDSLAADVTVRHQRGILINDTTMGGPSGDFIPAMAVQYHPTKGTRVWASGRPALNGGYDGVSFAYYGPFFTGTDTVRTLLWRPILEDGFAWNFDFNGDTAYIATDNGLFMYHETTGQSVVEEIPLLDPSEGNPQYGSRPAYGVRLIDTLLWVGTADGILSISQNDYNQQILFGREDSTAEVYAFPVPFRQSEGPDPNTGSIGSGVDFHFQVADAAGAEVTIEIYDFAMNLVRRVFDNRFFAQGSYTGSTSGVSEWDGRNGNGDKVAVGVYYFKVSFSTGDERWGKLAVIP